MKLFIKISILFTILFALTQVQIFSFEQSKAYSPENVLHPISHFYVNEKNYLFSMHNSVQFKGVDFRIYTIKPGDNFWKIAKEFNVNIDTLIAANPFWTELVAVTGQQIVVPSKKGVLLFIEKEQSIESVASVFNTTKDEVEIQYLKNFNKYHDKYGAAPLPIAVFVHGKKPSTHSMTTKLAQQYTLREMFRSPLGGRFSSFFGNRKHPIFKKKKFHSGVDIAAKRGTYVGAACAGKVIAAGWMGGYGKAVIIQHEDGYKTLYGHLSKINARQGKHVKKGQLIGRVGSTGYSTGPHLHFTLWHNNTLINPMKVLW